MPTRVIDGCGGEKQGRPWYAKVLIVLAVLLVVVGLPLTMLDLAGRSALRRQIDAVRATGAPLTFEEIEAHRPPIADDENGALVLVGLQYQLKAIGETYRRDACVPFLGKPKPPDFGDPYPAQMIAAIQTVITEQSEVLGELDRLRHLQRGRMPVTYSGFESLLPQLSPVRSAAKLKCLDSVCKASQGDVDSAALDSVVILNIGGSIAGEPNLICLLVAVSCDALAMQALEQALAAGVCADRTLLEIGGAIEHALASRSPTPAFWGERAAYMDIFSRAAEGDTAIFSISMSGAGVPPAGLYKYVRGLRLLDQAESLALVAPLCEPAESLKALSTRAATCEKGVSSLPPYYFVSRMFLPSFTRAVTVLGQSSARLRCARAGLALERFRLKRGQWPQDLADLVPELLRDIPVDPFDEQPLRYARTDRGVVVYSVGEDEVDDGGDVARPPKGSRGPPDVGFRLLDPDLRGFEVASESRER